MGRKTTSALFLRRRISFHLRRLSLNITILPFFLTPFLLLVINSPLPPSFLPSSSTLQHSNLPSTFGQQPSPPSSLTSSLALQNDRIHISLIFDQNRLPYALSTLRSIIYYNPTPLTFHILSPPSLHSSLLDLKKNLSYHTHLALYDHNLCVPPSSLLWFTSKRMHISALCKIFLPEILPIPRVLFLDSDLNAVSNISPCWFSATFPSQNQYLAMATDMGDSCQHNPDLCFPIGLKARVQKGLECGTIPRRAKEILKAKLPCKKAGDWETFQFNTGVLLMDLAKMRENHFTARIVQVGIQAWRATGFQQTGWGDQDLLNSFVRIYPEVVATLPCGCNYQYSASRREVRCAYQSISFVHAWHKQLVNESSRDPYNMHIRFFTNPLDLSRRRKISPPPVKRISQIDSTWMPAQMEHPVLDVGCSLQTHHCTAVDREHVERISLNRMDDTVNVLTRTARRPLFFREMRESVEVQTHTKVNHIVATDDEWSMGTYLKNWSDLVKLTPKWSSYDPQDVCRKCPSHNGECATAPSLQMAKLRQSFFDCYCATAYPMNGYMNELHKNVQPGWVVYLDDDNLLMDKWAISEMLANVKSKDSMLIFKSHLGRITPSEESFRSRKVVMGDMDSSNFVFHTDHMTHAKWVELRCGDFHVASRLSEALPTEWVNSSFIQANPLRDALGGQGKRKDVGDPSVTVVVTSYLADGWRPLWVRKIIEAYTDDSMKHIVDKVILVWNNVEKDVPSIVKGHERVQIVRPSKNSLNNRWVETLPHIETETVLNLDDDVYVKKEGLLCMLNWLKREHTRMVAPFVRRIEGHKYILNELYNSSAYSVVLPRILLAPTEYLRAYSNSSNTWFHEYIDTQEAHCDDIFLNMIGLETSKKPPLRVLLPEGSIVDFYSKCWKIDKALTGGLGLQSYRTERRSECVDEMMKKRELVEFMSSDHVGTCLARGNALSKERSIPEARFKGMMDDSLVCDGDCR